MKSLSIRWAIFYSHDQKLWVSGRMVPHRAVWALDVLERWRSIWVYLCLWKDCWPNNLDVISSAKLKIGEVRWGQIQDMFSKFVARSFRTCPVHQLQPKRWIFELCEWQHFAQHNRNSRSPQNPKQRQSYWYDPIWLISPKIKSRRPQWPRWFSLFFLLPSCCFDNPSRVLCPEHFV